MSGDDLPDPDTCEFGPDPLEPHGGVPWCKVHREYSCWQLSVDDDVQFLLDESERSLDAEAKAIEESQRLRRLLRKWRHLAVDYYLHSTVNEEGDGCECGVFPCKMGRLVRETDELIGVNNERPPTR